jgi:hypothetical protein
LENRFEPSNSSRLEIVIIEEMIGGSGVIYLDAERKKVENFVHQGLAIFLEFVELGFMIYESRRK